MSVATELLPPRLRAAIDGGAALDDTAAELLDDPAGAIELAAGSENEPAGADGLFGAAGFVLAASDDDAALMTGVVPAAPLQIAMLVGLGPRPVAADVEIVIGDLGGLERAFAAGALPEAVARVVAAPGRVHWLARASWNAPDGPAVREVEVLDGGPAGLLLCAPVPEEDDIAFMTCSATDVWRLLCALLPYPSEIA